MKKKILFIINNLNCGGAEKALVSLLENMNYSMYNVDLFLFKHEGVFFNKIPKQVNLLEEQLEYQYFDMPIKKAIVECIKSRRVDVAVARICAGYIFKSEKNRTRCEQRVWKYLSKGLKHLDQNYDVAIGYLEKSPIYFVVDKVKAKKKIGWIHTNYSNSGMDCNFDNVYFEQLDNIITVSEECAKSLEENFEHLKYKIKSIYNIVSPNLISELSNVNSIDNCMSDKSYVNILTVARLSSEKGIDMAIESCKQLVNKGYKIRWYVLGEGREREALEKRIESEKLEGVFKLLGIKENPYPYIRESDIYVQPSRYEGKSIAIDEAKILQKPIVVTNFSTAKDQIRNEENGVIVEMDSTAIFNGIKRIIDDGNLRDRLINNLSKENLGTESEIEKIYELIECY
ncbi:MULTISPECIES: glycosyltransferase [Bacillus]|uniref:Glycosyl transferase n=1 Tax=Bacillus cereus TaxID=1396 RepID=A0A2C1LCT5_BACCE|nr:MULTISPECIES: glycosyltransferase [Bacillus]PGT96257.1 glycosyl transferase [Bacillus cereus]PGX01840.1 glycosyl transferase [Bacillus sp. AFS033286]